MLEGNDHHVSIRIGIGIKNDVAVLRPRDDAHPGVIAFFGKVAKDAPGDLCSTAHVGVSPRRPQVIHSRAEYQISAFPK